MSGKIRGFLKAVFVALTITYLTLFSFYMLPIINFVLLEVYEGLPMLIPLTLMLYTVIDVFTPNKKHNSLSGLLYAEYIEHFVFPLVLLLSLTSSPILFVPTLFLLIYYFYGFVLGEVKNFKDAVSILSLTLLFVSLLWLPDLVFFINVITGLGKYIIVALLLMFAVLYVLHNFWKSCKLFPSTQVHFFKSYAMLLASGVVSISLLLQV